MSDHVENTEWVVIHCSDDDSHVLVKIEDVIYVGELNCDDKVKFYYLNENNKRKQYEGFVRGISCDYRKMVKLQDQLNLSTRPKRELSFHEELPRRAKVACNNTIIKKEKMEGNKKNASQLKSEQPSKRKRVDLSNSSSGSKAKSVTAKTPSSSSTDLKNSDDDDASVSSLSSGEQSVLIKLSQKQKRAEERKLSQLSAYARSSKGAIEIQGMKQALGDSSKSTQKVETSSEPTVNDSDSSVEVQIKKKVKKIDGNDSDSSVEVEIPKKQVGANKKNVGQTDKPLGAQTSSVSVEVKQVAVKAKRQQKEVRKIVFSGETLAYSVSKENARLVDSYDVYIPEKDLKRIRSTCGSSSVLTRRLTRKIFTTEARENCSVSGKPSMTKGQTMPEVRTALDQDGVNAIIEFVRNRAEKKKWPTPSDVSIKQWMANVLCEERKSRQLEQEAQEEEERAKKKAAEEKKAAQTETTDVGDQNQSEA